jgi:hypothetical protein
VAGFHQQPSPSKLGRCWCPPAGRASLRRRGSANMAAVPDNDGYFSDAPEKESESPGRSVPSSSAVTVSQPPPGPVAHGRPPPEASSSYREACIAEGSPAAHWARSATKFVDGRKEKLGKQVRKLRCLSLCTGMWSEGMVAEVPARGLEMFELEIKNQCSSGFFRRSGARKPSWARVRFVLLGGVRRQQGRMSHE